MLRPLASCSSEYLEVVPQEKWLSFYGNYTYVVYSKFEFQTYLNHILVKEYLSVSSKESSD